MLQLKQICKSYTTGDFTQTALDHVSVSFRDNEFVAILGPSGSGKTTLLNIVGGLDHYDSGDLVIDGISTKQYQDRDWDTYRNNRIGFVFQSYNLIPHQTVLANVELALTLSGVSPEERKQRALEELDRVGLKEHAHKKPSQLSGGQMQRVAIARALINDPEILLADEPTGALDSKTSVQVMDLLTEIAKNRLVVMVTHNPELAEQYATRIVNLSDGVIISDTDPYEPTPEEMHLSTKEVRRTSMSFLTALSLSFNNLMTKKGRTIMTAFAGSIGIIGIAAILSLANGVNDYIKTVEEETLSEYPLQITSSGLDMTAMLVGAEGAEVSEDEADENDASGNAASESSAEGANAEGSNDGSSEGSGEASDASINANAEDTEDGNAPTDEVRVVPLISGMFSSVGQNDLASLKTFLDSGESGIEQYTKTIEYTYNVAPQIFLNNTENVRQVNPDKSMSALGLGSGNSTNSLMSMTMSTDVFYEMPSDPSLYETQYDVVAGRWPENYNELILVLTPGGGMSDFMLYSLGLRDSAELDEMVKQFAAEEEVVMPAGIRDYAYDEVLGITFKLVNAFDYYSYDSAHGVWVNKQDNEDHMRGLVESGEELTIVGVVQPDPDASATMLMMGVNYPASLTEHVINKAAESQIVKDQLADPNINVFTGKAFGEDEEGGLGIDSMFSIDTGALQSAFQFDTAKLAEGMNNLDLSIDQSKLPEMPDLSMPGTGGTQNNDQSTTTQESVQKNARTTTEEGTGNNTDITPGNGTGSGTIEGGQGQTPSIPGGSTGGAGLIDDATANAIASAIVSDYLTWSGKSENANKSFDDYWATNQTTINGIITAHTAPIIGNVTQNTLVAYSTYLEGALGNYVQKLTAAIEAQVGASMQLASAQMAANMAGAMNIDASAFSRAFQFNMTEEDLSELIVSMMASGSDTYENNLSKLGYADFTEPYSINIYPIDFESKEEVLAIIDGYNELVESQGEDDKVVNYTDIVGALMSSVTDIVNMISYVLIAFVAISLVVSSIMIGVITYISVLERKKEIGILRAIGASKGNISSVFNAETVIEGLVAGLLGVGVTALVCIPVSALIYSLFDVPNIASLPWEAAVALVIISVVLTTIAGIIPSSAASRKDPVEALRSE